MRSDLIDLAMILHHETERAVLVSDDGDKEKAVWLPRSVIEVERAPNGDRVVITLPVRLAKEKRLV